MASDVSKTLLAQLKNPFDPRFVKFRVGATNKDKTKGIALAYIDSREVMRRLDDVCGIDGWESRYLPMDGGFICQLSIRMPDGRWVTKSNAAGFTLVEPIKGGASDALKRAAATWGIGRYLYYLPNSWVPITAQGKSYVLTATPVLPKWALPGKVERWEDVAELEADVNSGADDVVSLADDGIDQRPEEERLTASIAKAKGKIE